MGLLNAILGNATAIDPKEIEAEFKDILCVGENIESAYRVVRDKWIFTNKRLIMLDVQGVTGTKREYRSIPYHSIAQFSIETAGSLDDDCEMKIWVRGLEAPIKQDFSRGTDIIGIQKSLAGHIL